MTIKFKTYKIVAFVLFFSSIWAMVPMHVFAQNDFESWNGIEANFKLSKKASVAVSNELRLQNNATSLKKYLADVGAEYKFARYFEAGIAYRYSRLNEIEYFSNEHLLFAKLALSGSFDRFTLSLQTRIQRAYEVFGLATLYSTTNTWRNKAALEYNIYGMPLAAYFTCEIFAKQRGNSFVNDKYRAFLGAKYKLNKGNSINLSYGVQRSYIKPGTSYLLGLSYRLNFDLRK